MSSGLVYGPPRTSSTSGTRGNAVPLTIPRNPATSGGRTERSFADGSRETFENDSRNSFSSRYNSPRSGRLSGDQIPNSYGAEGTSPSPSVLRRPKDKRKGSSSLPTSGWKNRTEGFNTVNSASSSSEAIPLHVPQLNVTSSPKKPGLLSRTLSSGVNNSDVLKEKLEHCLESQPSLGQDTDGESRSYLHSLQATHSVFKTSLVATAFNIANFSYNDRQHGQAILKQCVDTACILANIGADETTVAAALLKDVLLQSMMTEKQLRSLVKENVVELVLKVGRLNDICKVREEMVEASKGAELDQEASQRISHLLLTLADVHGVLIKLADRLAALQSARPGPELISSAKEALEVFAPMANRLGVWSIKAALEDLAFKVLHPAEHEELQEKLRESQDRGTLEAALDSLSGVLQDRGLEGVDLSGRPKNLYGVMRKMWDKQKGLNQVYDVRALRVVVKSKHDCYAVLQEVHRLWPEVKDRFKDYIRSPKANGYQSLHTVVKLPDGRPMEIQIRTDKMHFIAEYGIAAHWRYKERDASTRNQSEAQQVNWARWLISWSLELKDAKCRPKGSPPGDSSLANLATKICAFPHHVPGCKFAEFASRVAPKPVSLEELAEAPVLVVCLDHTKPVSASSGHTSIEELPPRCTLGQLPAVLGIPANSHILVNMEQGGDESQVLAHGDRIEIFTAPSLQRLSVEELQSQRQRLQKLFGCSASPTVAA